MVFKENFHDISSFGGLPLYFLACLIFLILGETRIFYQLVLGIVVAHVFYFSCRIVYFRERPKKRAYKTWLQKIDANSFVSAHALRVALLFFVLGVFFENFILWIIFSVAILATGAMRVYLKQHWFSDVVLGWIFGILIGLFLIKII